MDSIELRRRGRRAQPRRGPRPEPTRGLSSGAGKPGETLLNVAQMTALEDLYNSSPAISAARSVLHGQLFSSGITLRRDGAAVKLQPAFQQHLSTKWLDFATNAFDALLKWGSGVRQVRASTRGMNEKYLNHFTTFTAR